MIEKSEQDGSKKNKGFVSLTNMPVNLLEIVRKALLQGQAGIAAEVIGNYLNMKKKRRRGD